MRILMTGGCGYIGSVLVPLLQRADTVDEVVVLDSLGDGSRRNLVDVDLSDGFSFHRGDVRRIEQVERAAMGADAIVHLAAITGAESTFDREDETFAVNFEGTRNVLRVARELGIDNVVYASSCNTYGRTTSMEIDETVEPRPINPYAEAKLKAERLVTDFGSRGDRTTTSLRLSTNYGFAPGIRFNLVVNYFVFRALTGQPLTVYGDGRNWRPFIHVEDAARAFADAVLNPEVWQSTVYNVGANEGNFRILKLAELIRDTIDPTVEIVHLEEEQPGPSYNISFDRLAETGFEPLWTIPAGIEDLAGHLGDTSELRSPAMDMVGGPS